MRLFGPVHVIVTKTLFNIDGGGGSIGFQGPDGVKILPFLKILQTILVHDDPSKSKISRNFQSLGYKL